MVTVSLWGGRWRVNGGEGSNARRQGFRNFDLLRDLLRNLPCDCTSQSNLYESVDCARSQLDYVDGSASVHEFRNEELDGISTHCVARTIRTLPVSQEVVVAHLAPTLRPLPVGIESRWKNALSSAGAISSASAQRIASGAEGLQQDSPSRAGDRSPGRSRTPREFSYPRPTDRRQRLSN